MRCPGSEACNSAKVLTADLTGEETILGIWGLLRLGSAWNISKTVCLGSGPLPEAGKAGTGQHVGWVWLRHAMPHPRALLRWNYPKFEPGIRVFGIVHGRVRMKACTNSASREM